MSKFKAFGGVGHGGSDSGAVGNGLRESDINLVQALAWEKEMKRHGVEVKLSRYRDENDNINEEVRECNEFNPNIAVDFHTNSGGGDGCEFLHSVVGTNSKRLANCINEEVIKFGQNSRGLKIRTRNDGRDYFAFIRDTQCPAVISECAFIDNSNDISIVDTKAEQEAYGVAVAKGCLKYLGITYNEEIPNISSDKNINVTYQVHTKGKWLSNVVNLNDYAGIYGNPIQGVYANLSEGSIRYRVHTQNGEWLPYVIDRQDYAGILSKNIDALQMELIGLEGYSVKYRAYVGGRWLPWVTDLEDYAGILGKPIEGIQIQIIKK